jgi:hypothetical protein
VRNIYCSLLLFLIGVMQKGLAWEAQYLTFENQFRRSRRPRRVTVRSPTEAAGPWSAEPAAAVELPLAEIAPRPRVRSRTLSWRNGNGSGKSQRAVQTRDRDLLPIAAGGLR